MKTFWVGCPLSISSTTVWFNFGVTVSSFSQFPGLLVFCFCTPTIIAHVPSNLFPRSLYFSKHQANPPLSILFILATSLLHPCSIHAPSSLQLTATMNKQSLSTLTPILAFEPQINYGGSVERVCIDHVGVQKIQNNHPSRRKHFAKK